MGFARLSKYYQRFRQHDYWVRALSPSPFLDSSLTSFQFGPWGSNFSTKFPYPKTRKYPSSGFNIPSEYHQHTRHQLSISTCALISRQCFSRGLSPFSVFPVSRSNLSPDGPNHSGYVSPSEFRTLSTLCSPRNLPNLFHFGPALGISLRGFIPFAPLYALFKRLSPHKVALQTEVRSAFLRGLFVAKISPESLGINQVLCDTSLGFAPFKDFCSRWLLIHYEPASPLALFRLRRLLANPFAPQGFSPPRTWPHSLKLDIPPWSSLPRQPSRFFVVCQTLGHPSEGLTRRRAQCFLFASCLNCRS
jgi:hypothetical protein